MIVKVLSSSPLVVKYVSINRKTQAESKKIHFKSIFLFGFDLFQVNRCQEKNFRDSLIVTKNLFLLCSRITFSFFIFYFIHQDKFTSVKL